MIDPAFEPKCRKLGYSNVAIKPSCIQKKEGSKYGGLVKYELINLVGHVASCFASAFSTAFFSSTAMKTLPSIMPQV